MPASGSRSLASARGSPLDLLQPLALLGRQPRPLVGVPLGLSDQFRSVSAEQPIFPAIEEIVAHCDACSASCSRTIRTARARTSGEYLPGVPMAPILAGIGASRKPGPVQTMAGAEA